MAGREGHGALDDLNVLGLGLDVGLLEARVGVAFVGGHEAGAHLYPCGTKLKEFVDVRALVHAAGSNDRDGALGPFFELPYRGHDFR